MATTGPDGKTKRKERGRMAETFLFCSLPATREPSAKSGALRSVNAEKWRTDVRKLGGTTDAKSFRPLFGAEVYFFVTLFFQNEETNLWNGPD